MHPLIRTPTPLLAAGFTPMECTLNSKALHVSSIELLVAQLGNNTATLKLIFPSSLPAWLWLRAAGRMTPTTPRHASVFAEVDQYLVNMTGNNG